MQVSVLNRKYLTVFLLSASITINVLAQENAQEKYQDEGYRLVWADEFNKDGKPDPATWRHEAGFVRNQELQWYQTGNAWCENGKLIIEARKEPKPNPGFKEAAGDWKSRRKTIEYTSSSINTAGLKSWQYGRFVMRGKIDVSAGLWPAWWTLGLAGEWPANGEIDIMEYYAGKILANIAVATSKKYTPEWYSQTRSIKELGGREWASRFHIWRMDWTEESISLFVDDVMLITVPMEKLFNKDGSHIHPFKQPHYMLLNLAMGGMNGGDIGNTRFPNRFEIDYIRVYQR